MMTNSNPSSLTAVGLEEPFVPTLCLIHGFGLLVAGTVWKVVRGTITRHGGSHMMTKSNPSSLTAVGLEEPFVPTLCLMPCASPR